MMHNRNTARQVSYIGLLVIGHSVLAQEHHPLDGALLPTRATLRSIAAEQWKGLPGGYRLPAAVDLSARLPPPGDQGRQNSCIAWAVAYGIGSYHRAQVSGLLPTDSTGAMVPQRVLSPAFPFDLTKSIFDTTDTRCLGSYFSKVFSILMEKGCCTWDEMPYDPSPMGCFNDLPEKALHAAHNNIMAPPLRISPYELDQVRYHLAEGRPVAFAMGIDTAFKNAGKRAAKGAPFRWDPDCAQPMPGSHAMLAVGYSDTDSTFLVMNSWGRQWGEGGFWRMTYSQFDCHVTEAYIVPSSTKAVIDLVLHEPEKNTDRARMKVKLRPGEHAEVKGLALALAQHVPDADKAVLLVKNVSNSDSTSIERLDLVEDRPLRFFVGEDLMTVTYTKASRTHDVRRTRAHIVTKVEEQGTEPTEERAILLSDRIRSARAARP
ncbi:MAG: C1 family peptidase [Flavobacteriales bacterium]